VIKSFKTFKMKKQTIVIVGCVAVPVVLAVLIVALNWSTLVRTARATALEIAQLQPVRAALQTRYRTMQVKVDSVHYGRSPAVLRIQITNSPWLQGLQPAVEDQQAREIAVAANALLPRNRRYARFSVTIGNQLGTGISYGTSSTHPIDLGTSQASSRR
jgi:hypothetical protein